MHILNIFQKLDFSFILHIFIWKQRHLMNTVDFFTFCELHQLWQAVILKPFKLEECILHFWKSPIFINMVPTSQGHSYILNTKKSILQIAGFILVSVVAGCIIFWESVYMVQALVRKLQSYWLWLWLLDILILGTSKITFQLKNFSMKSIWRWFFSL